MSLPIEREREMIYGAKAETRNESFIEETIREETNRRNSVYNCKHIVQLKGAFSWFVM